MNLVWLGVCFCTDLLIGIEMDIGEFALAELLAEVMERIKHSNGLEFVSSGLAREVVDGINAGFASGEVGGCVDRFL